MIGFIYAAEIGSFIKVGWTTWNPSQRAQTLRSDYGCEVRIIAAIEGRSQDERRFHRDNRELSVTAEIYPRDAEPILRFLRDARPFVSEPRRPRKPWSVLAPGVIPVSRYQLGKAAFYASAHTADAQQ